MRQAILVLEDGSVFRGLSVGATVNVVAEVVFNTAMTGYQEVITDPSYAGQMVTFTCPHIGNVGVNEIDQESNRPQVVGVILKAVPTPRSSWRGQLDFQDYLKQHGIAAIAGIDTRRLTSLLREGGAQRGCMMVQNPDPDVAHQMAQHAPQMAGQNLAAQLKKTVILPEYNPLPEATSNIHVVLYDFGVKANIVALLRATGCTLTIIPATTPIETLMHLRPDAVVLSNGPGDPAACVEIIECVSTILKTNLPVLGICLGFQILALAYGARTFKMRFGHRGSNHPIQDLKTGRVWITAQNHGFAVDPSTLPAEIEPTHISLFDGTLQGFAHRQRPIFAFQGHPEASPGPHDMRCVFDQFMIQVKVWQKTWQKEQI
jgi:carbamoyl-phosphate synthase small subunit